MAAGDQLSAGQGLLAALICLAGLGFGAVLVPAPIGVYGNLPSAAVPHTIPNRP